jgi:hypothetical protein
VEEYTYHEASPVELMTLVPPAVIAHSMNLAHLLNLSVTFMVCDQTNTVEHGTIRDTFIDKYFTFEVMLNDEGRFEILQTSDWMVDEREADDQ